MACLASAVAACTTPPATPEPTPVSEAEPGTAQYDKDVFETLLGNHELIRREVKHPGVQRL